MKYRNKPTVVDNHRFPSKREAIRYQSLKSLLLAGEITNLELQPSYPITINGHKICKVNLDFRYFCNKTNKQIIEDSKGYDNQLSKLKRKLVEAQHGIEVVIV
jgi:hypothetical protein